MDDTRSVSPQGERQDGANNPSPQLQKPPTRAVFLLPGGEGADSPVSRTRALIQAKCRSMSMVEKMLIALAVILAVPWLVWRLGRTERWAPLVVVQILTGILLGPGLLGGAFPDAYRWLFPPEVITALGGIATWGVMLFVWIAGIELDLHQVWQRRRDTLTTVALATTLPMLAGALVAAGMLWHSPGWVGAGAQGWQFMAAIGMACSVTALPILILFMEKLGILRAPLGQRVLRYASLEDIAIWAVLALILLDFDRLGRQASFFLGFAAGGYGPAPPDAAAGGVRPLVPVAGVAGAVRAGGRLGRAALHGRRVPGRRGAGRRLVRPAQHGPAASLPVAGDDAGVFPVHRPEDRMGAGRRGGAGRGAGLAGGSGGRPPGRRGAGCALAQLAVRRGAPGRLAAADQGPDHDHLRQHPARPPGDCQ